MQNRIRHFSVWLGFVLFLCACQSQTPQSPEQSSQANASNPSYSNFVKVKNKRFYLNGKPYYFVGANFWYGAYLGADSQGQKRLIKELDLLKQTGVTNLRVLAAAERTDLSRALDEVVHLGPGEYNEALLKGLDFLLVELHKRDMKAVLYLNNFWQWSGGMNQYMAWLSGKPVIDPDLSGDWTAFINKSAEFYRSEQAQLWYQQLIEKIINRTNSISGVGYKDEPAIMAWQLANEPRPGRDTQYAQAYIDWIDASARFIKSLDPNHLVSTGSEGLMGSGESMDVYKTAHSSSAIDYLTFHMWPKNWGWYDATDGGLSFRATLAKSRAYILQHIQVADELNKPTVLEEFGLERDEASYSPAAKVSKRDEFFSAVFDLIARQAALGQPIAGTNFWSWGGFGRAQHRDYWWQDGDPFTGDPPQEAQGLNSVFNTDTTTLEILKAHALEMRSLQKGK